MSIALHSTSRFQNDIENRRLIRLAVGLLFRNLRHQRRLEKRIDVELGIACKEKLGDQRFVTRMGDLVMNVRRPPEAGIRLIRNWMNRLKLVVTGLRSSETRAIFKTVFVVAISARIMAVVIDMPNIEHGAGKSKNNTRREKNNSTVEFILTMLN